MNESKLIVVFRTIEKKELRDLKKWVQSPMHNEHKDVTKLFEFLFTRYNLNATTLKKERVWKYLYGHKKYDALRLRHVLSFSLNVLENFVSYKALKRSSFEHEKRLVKAYRDKKILKPATQSLQKAAKHLGKESHKDEQYHYNQYELEVLKFDLEGTQDRTRATNITEITKHASLFFMITTLRHAYTARSHQSLKKAAYRVPLLESVLTEVEENDYALYPILMIYYHGYQTLNRPEEESHFKELNYYLEQQQPVLGAKEQREILLMALNYAIKKINTGSQFYMQEAFRLYKKGLEENLLIEQDEMSHFAYKNIVSLGIILKEYTWLDVFIPTYALKLKGDSKNNYRDYSLARLTFARGDFDQTMQLLIQADYDDILLNIGAKVLLLKLYYQQAYWDALEALLESFRIFLNRKKELSYHKEHYTNLILLVRKILSTPILNQLVREKIKEQIESTHPLAEREWLLAQVL
ncbi:MAG: Unknown protein [uncultured Aureispira sp.]|uniref:Uncharacterized protein n=1 Tax=uncultured Aureispira sp. TaxID=1331704 RepID=A0A6S6UKL1_9BACT|nr:MAG: Unknown protein [uncultured Aureispira sp.]